MSVLAWGSNKHKELGLDDLYLSAVPVLVTQLEGAGLVDVSAGNGHTLLLNENGQVFAFGKGSEGQLGVSGKYLQSTRAMQVTENGLGEAIITKIVAGDGCSAAISNRGELFEWGFIHSAPKRNDAYSVASNALHGLANRSNHMSPRLKELLRESELEYTMGGTLPEAGEERAGAGEETTMVDAEAGVLAVRTRRQRAFAPVRSAFKLRVRDIALGFGHSLIVVEGEESLWAKGYNDRGQLGVGTRVNEVDFVRVLGALRDKPIASIACGNAHNLVIVRGSGELYSWGSNVLGQLGLSAGVADQLSPARVFLDEQDEEEIANQVACGSYHSVVLSTKRTLFSFGHAEYGQHGSLETGSSEEQQQGGAGDFRQLLRHFFTPQRVWRFHRGGGGVELERILVGQQFNAALDVEGRIWTWGFGASGNLGHGMKQRSMAPQAIEALVGYKILRFTAGHTHMLALTAPEGNPFALKNYVLLSEEETDNRGGGFDAVLCSPKNSELNYASCHYAIVSARCPALAERFTEGKFLLPLPTERLVIRALLEYLYCDVVRTCPPHRLKDLQTLAQRLGLPRLAGLCQLKRYQRNLCEGFLILPADATVTSLEQITPSTFSRDMLHLFRSGVRADALLAASDFSPNVPPGHCASTWRSFLDRADFPSQGHTSYSWRGGAGGQTSQCFKVHRPVFFRYPFFHVLLNGTFREGEIARMGGVVRLGSLDSYRVLAELLQWVYSGAIQGGVHADNVAELLHAARAFGVEDLANACERFLLSVLSVDNARDILDLAQDHFLSKLAKECEHVLLLA